LWFGMHFASLRTKIALIRESIRTIVLGKKWARQACIDYFMGRMGQGSWGR